MNLHARQLYWSAKRLRSGHRKPGDRILYVSGMGHSTSLETKVIRRPFIDLLANFVQCPALSFVDERDQNDQHYQRAHHDHGGKKRIEKRRNSVSHDKTHLLFSV